MPLKPCIKSTNNLNSSDIDSILESYDSYVETMDSDSAAKNAIDDTILSVKSERKEYIDLFNETYPNALKESNQNNDLTEKNVIETPVKETVVIQDDIKKQPDNFSQLNNLNKEPVSKSISVENLKRLVKIMQKENSGTRFVTFHIRATQEEAFGKNSKKEHGVIKGGFYDGTNEIVLIAENIEDVNDAITVIRHETVGHYGLRQLLNGKGQYDKLLNRVYESRENELKELYDWVEKEYPDLIRENDILKIADEMLARSAEVKTKSNLLTKIYDLIILLLNKTGLVMGKISKSEVKSLIRLSESNLKKSTLSSYRDDIKKSKVESSVLFSKKQSEDNGDSVIPEETKKILDGINKTEASKRLSIKKFLQRQLTKEGLLNKSIFEMKLKTDAIKNVGEEEISYLVYNFEKAIKNTYKKSYNKLTKEQLVKINEYLKGNKDSVIPNGIKESTDLMRNHLDVMSIKMLNSIHDLLKLKVSNLSENQRLSYDVALATDGKEGKIPDHIAGNLETMLKMVDNIGVYMTRSYQAFDDKNWKNKALLDSNLMMDAIDFISENNPKLTKSEVVGAIRSILQDAQDSGNFVTMISSGTKIGSKDVSIMKKRKEVPEVIRRLLGEYQDPKLNFARSASKMQWYVANHEFLMNVRTEGLGVFMFDKPTGQFDTRIATKGSESMNPLDGLYTTEDIRIGMEDALNKFDGSDLMRNLVRINSMIKYGKTILSPSGQARNFQSASIFSVLNGHFNWLYAAKAFKVAKADLFTKDEKWKNYITDLIGLGVLHDNPYAGELKEAINDVTDADIYKNDVLQPVRKFLNWMQKSYQVGDDFWKIIGFENELASFKKSGLSNEDARKKAAYRIRNGYPTYSMIPRAVKKVRRWPLIGSFVSFPYEIMRTSYNQFGFISEDIKENRTAMASKRIIGMAIASSAAYAISKMTMSLMGMSDDDDESVKAQLPEWSRNSQLAYIGYDEDGLPIYIDMSYIDPYTYLKKPISALMSGNNIDIKSKVLDSITEIAEPFLGTDIAAGVVLEVWTNKKSSGGKVYNPEDTGQKIVSNIVNHVRKGIQPGMMSSIERTVQAMRGEISTSGKEYKVKDELLAWVGHRVGTLNLTQSMVYKGYEFSDNKRMSLRVLSKVVGSQRNVSDNEIEEAFNSMISSRLRAYNRMIKYVDGARSLGVTDSNIKKSLSSSGISSRDTLKIMQGNIPDFKLKYSFLKSAKDRAIATSSSDSRKQDIVILFKERQDLIRNLVNDYVQE